MGPPAFYTKVLNYMKVGQHYYSTKIRFVLGQVGRKKKNSSGRNVRKISQVTEKEGRRKVRELEKSEEQKRVIVIRWSLIPMYLE